MKVARRALLLFGLGAVSLFGQRDQFVQLQREIAIFEDQLRNMQKLIEEKLAQLSQQAQQATEAAGRTQASFAELEARINEQNKAVAQPVATIGSKVDQMSAELQAVREAVASLNARFGKLEQQLTDISTALRTLQSPPTPPALTPSIPAETLFQNALRDREGGNLDLALREFSDYVQFYGETEQAAAAQYYIGDIHYRSERYQEAVEAFDKVLSNYTNSDRAPDAHYMKGMALLKLGETAKARSEFNALIKRFPNNELADKARSQLRALNKTTRSK